MKTLVGTFDQEKALVGAFSVIVQLHRLTDLRHYTVQRWAGTPGSRDQQDHRGGGCGCGGCLPTRGARSVAAGQGHVWCGAAVLCAQLRLTRYYRTALRTAALSFGVTLGAGWPGRPPPVLELQTNLREL